MTNPINKQRSYEEQLQEAGVEPQFFKDLVQKLRQYNFALTIFTPDEVGEAHSDDIEDAMLSRGWDTINATL